MRIESKNNVNVYGTGRTTLVLGHGFGCDQTMWHLLVPLFQPHYRIVLYDLTGSGRSHPASYDPALYSSLQRHADDLLDILREYCEGPAVFIGHSVSAMIGMLATIAEPKRFAGQIMVAPSPCYINDDDYVGGFNHEEIDGLLDLMHDNYIKWSERMGPVIMGRPDRPDLQQELTDRFCRNDPGIARHFARVTFTSDLRAQVPRSRTPALVLQCTDDLIAPREVGDWLHAHLPDSRLALIDNAGHCPHMSAPQEAVLLMEDFLARLGV